MQIICESIVLLLLFLIFVFNLYIYYGLIGSRSLEKKTGIKMVKKKDYQKGNLLVLKKGLTLDLKQGFIRVQQNYGSKLFHYLLKYSLKGSFIIGPFSFSVNQYLKVLLSKKKHSVDFLVYLLFWILFFFFLVCIIVGRSKH